MNLSRYFDIKRIKTLLKVEIYQNYRTWLISWGSILGVIVAIDVVSGFLTGSPFFTKYFIYIGLFGYGFILNSIAFRDMHRDKRGLLYLTIPASDFEKFLSKIVIYGIFYFLFALLFYWAIIPLLNTLNNFLFPAFSRAFSFPMDTFLELSKPYFILQSVFLFSGAYFKKNAFLKLIFTLFLLNIALSIYLSINAKIFLDTWNLKIEQSAFLGDLSNFGSTLSNIFEFIYHWLLAPYFWILTILRIKEKEI